MNLQIEKMRREIGDLQQEIDGMTSAMNASTSQAITTGEASSSNEPSQVTQNTESHVDQKKDQALHEENDVSNAVQTTTTKKKKNKRTK